MTLGRDLRDTLVRQLAEPWDENPLMTLGLSPAILGLGLSDDELFDFVHRIARDLVVRFHPDRRAGERTPEQVRFSDAFRVIKDRAVFDKALEEFRRTAGQEREELLDARSTLRTRTSALEKTRADLALLSSESQAVREERSVFATSLSTYLRVLALRAKLTGPLQRELETGGSPQSCFRLLDCRRVVVLSFCLGLENVRRVKHDGPSEDEVREEYRKVVGGRSRQLVAESAIERLRGVAHQAGLTVQRPRELIDQALRSKQSLPSVSWDVNSAFAAAGMKVLCEAYYRGTGQIVGPSSEAVAKIPHSYVRRLDQAYRKALELLGDILWPSYPLLSTFVVCPEVYEVEGGWLKGSDFQIVGTLHARDLVNVNEENARICDGQLSLAEMLVMRKAMPLVYPESMLVTTKLQTRLISGKNAGTQRRALVERLRNPNFHSPYFASNIVLQIS